MAAAHNRQPVLDLTESKAENLRAVLLFVAFAVTFGGLSTILRGYWWWVLCVVLALAVFGGGALIRAAFPTHRILTRIVGPLFGAIVAAVVIMVRFSAGTAFMVVFPTNTTIDLFRKLIRDAGYSITWQAVPADADEGISLLLALGAVALLILAEILVFSLGLPALAGIPLAAVFLVPSATPDGRTDGWFFAAGAITFLALLFHGRVRQLIPAAWLAAIAVVCALVIPTFLPSTQVTTATSSIGPSVATGVNPMINLGDDLRSSQPKTALTYSTVSGDPEYLRLTEISDFNGRQWGPERPDLQPNRRPVEFPKAPGLDVGISTSREVSYIHVDNLVSPWLPIPYPATSVTGLTGQWSYIPESFTVASNESLARAQNYTVTSVVLTPTPKQLQAAGTYVPQGLTAYLELPTDTPAIIGQTARKVTAEDSSNYEKALSIQQFLRSSPFVYSESAPVSAGYDGTGVDVVAQFLEEHKGYCIHFASAMAVMARELGIPSRIIVGFQPGTLQNGDDNGRKLYAVTNKDLHAWPELYFSSIGWVRFEPTPSRGRIPDYANQSLAGVPNVGSGNGANGNPSTRNEGKSPQLSEGTLGTAWRITSDPTFWITLGSIGFGLLALLAQPLLIRGIRRSRRMRTIKSGNAGALLGWSEIKETAEDLGIDIGENLTPREAVAHLGRRRGMTESDREALDRICKKVERAGYGQRFKRSSKVDAELVADIRIVLRCLRRTSDAGNRVSSRLLPKSLVSRIVNQVRRFA